MYKERIKICESCDKMKVVLGYIKQCSLCWCLLDIKARVTSESCPIDKWDKKNRDTSNEKCGGC